MLLSHSLLALYGPSQPNLSFIILQSFNVSGIVSVKSNDSSCVLKSAVARNARHDYAHKREREARALRKESHRGTMKIKSGTQFPLPFSPLLPIFSTHDSSVRLTNTISVLSALCTHTSLLSYLAGALSAVSITLFTHTEHCARPLSSVWQNGCNVVTFPQPQNHAY